MYSRIVLQTPCWHVLSSVMESTAALTQSSCPSGTDRFLLRHSRHFVPGYYHAVPPGQGRQTPIKLTLMESRPTPADRAGKFALGQQPPFVGR